MRVRQARRPKWETLRISSLGALVLAFLATSCTRTAPHQVPDWAQAELGTSFCPVTGLPFRVIDKKTGIALNLVVPGTFVMGVRGSAPEELDPEALPRHPVRITRPFYLGRYELTEAELHRLTEGEQKREWSTTLPACGVSWDDAVAAAERGGFRLPTEAEWEYACRAGSETRCYGPLDKIAWYQENGGYALHPVGQKSPNAWGFYDMIGNVREWCEDSWDESIYETRGGETSDPVNRAPSEWRVTRGGSYIIHPMCLGAGVRTYAEPRLEDEQTGVRLAHDP